MQSRNFRLQKVGDIKWLENNYKFHEIASSLDELVILNASRNNNDFNFFSENVKKLAKTIFMPITAGGQIRNLQDIKLLFKSGADKVIFNTKFFTDPNFIKSVTKVYGVQSIVASIDYKNIEGHYKVFIDQGKVNTNLNLYEYINRVEKIEIGEIYLNSIDRDGTGFGYDLQPFINKNFRTKTSIILAGGAGKSEHFKQGLEMDEVNAVATANLFNFMGDGLKDSRVSLLNEHHNLATWKTTYKDFDKFNF